MSTNIGGGRFFNPQQYKLGQINADKEKKGTAKEEQKEEQTTPELSLPDEQPTFDMDGLDALAEVNKTIIAMKAPQQLTDEEKAESINADIKTIEDFFTKLGIDLNGTGKNSNGIPYFICNIATEIYGDTSPENIAKIKDLLPIDDLDKLIQEYGEDAVKNLRLDFWWMEREQAVREAKTIEDKEAAYKSVVADKLTAAAKKLQQSKNNAEHSAEVEEKSAKLEELLDKFSAGISNTITINLASVLFGNDISYYERDAKMYDFLEQNGLRELLEKLSELEETSQKDFENRLYKYAADINKSTKPEDIANALKDIINGVINDSIVDKLVESNDKPSIKVENGKIYACIGEETFELDLASLNDDQISKLMGKGIIFPSDVSLISRCITLNSGEDGYINHSEPTLCGNFIVVTLTKADGKAPITIIVDNRGNVSIKDNSMFNIAIENIVDLKTKRENEANELIATRAEELSDEEKEKFKEAIESFKNEYINDSEMSIRAFKAELEVEFYAAQLLDDKAESYREAVKDIKEQFKNSEIKLSEFKNKVKAEFEKIKAQNTPPAAPETPVTYTQAEVSRLTPSDRGKYLVPNDNGTYTLNMDKINEDFPTDVYGEIKNIDDLIKATSTRDKDEVDKFFEDVDSFMPKSFVIEIVKKYYGNGYQENNNAQILLMAKVIKGALWDIGEPKGDFYKGLLKADDNIKAYIKEALEKFDVQKDLEFQGSAKLSEAVQVLFKKVFDDAVKANSTETRAVIIKEEIKDLDTVKDKLKLDELANYSNNVPISANSTPIITYLKHGFNTNNANLYSKLWEYLKPLFQSEDEFKEIFNSVVEEVMQDRTINCSGSSSNFYYPQTLINKVVEGVITAVKDLNNVTGEFATRAETTITNNDDGSVTYTTTTTWGDSKCVEVVTDYGDHATGRRDYYENGTLISYSILSFENGGPYKANDWDHGYYESESINHYTSQDRLKYTQEKQNGITTTTNYDENNRVSTVKKEGSCPDYYEYHIYSGDEEYVYINPKEDKTNDGYKKYIDGKLVEEYKTTKDGYEKIVYDGDTVTITKRTAYSECVYEEKNGKQIMKTRTEFEYKNGHIVTEKTYDNKNNLISTTEHKYNSDGQIKSSVTKDKDGNTIEKTKYSYSYGYLDSSKTTYADGTVVETIYGSTGIASEVTKKDGKIVSKTEYTYGIVPEANGKALISKKTTVYNSDGTTTVTITDKNGKTVQTLDKQGNVISEEKYDAQGNQITTAPGENVPTNESEDGTRDGEVDDLDYEYKGYFGDDACITDAKTEPYGEDGTRITLTVYYHGSDTPTTVEIIKKNDGSIYRWEETTRVKNADGTETETYCSFDGEHNMEYKDIYEYKDKNDKVGRLIFDEYPKEGTSNRYYYNDSNNWGTQTACVEYSKDNNGNTVAITYEYGEVTNMTVVDENGYLLKESIYGDDCNITDEYKYDENGNQISKKTTTEYIISQVDENGDLQTIVEKTVVVEIDKDGNKTTTTTENGVTTVETIHADGSTDEQEMPDWQKAGFKSEDDYKDALEHGYSIEDAKQFYEDRASDWQKAGFNSEEDYNDAISKGYNDPMAYYAAMEAEALANDQASDWQKAGFNSQEDYNDAISKGYNNPLDYYAAMEKEDLVNGQSPMDTQNEEHKADDKNTTIVTNSDGSVTTTKKDDKGNVISEVVTKDNKTVSETTNTYDDQGALTETKTVNYADDGVRIAGEVTYKYSTDNNGVKTTEQYEAGPDGTERLTSVTKTKDNKIISSIEYYRDEDGNEIGSLQKDYDPNDPNNVKLRHQVETIVNRDGSITIKEFYNYGVRTHYFESSEKTIVDGKVVAETYQRWPQDHSRPIYTKTTTVSTDPNTGITTQTTSIEEETANGKETSDLITRSKTINGKECPFYEVVTKNGKEMSITTAEYDDKGNLSKRTMINKDSNGDVIATVSQNVTRNEDGSCTVSQYETGADGVARKTYDATIRIDENGNEIESGMVEYYYNPDGTLSTEVATTYNGENSTSSYTYYSYVNGELTKKSTDVYNGTEWVSSSAQTFTKNSDGTTTIHQKEVGQDRVLRPTYDVTMKDGEEYIRTEYKYDDNGNLTTSYTSLYGQDVATTDYIYDENGKLSIINTVVVDDKGNKINVSVDKDGNGSYSIVQGGEQLPDMISITEGIIKPLIFHQQMGFIGEYLAANPELCAAFLAWVNGGEQGNFHWQASSSSSNHTPSWYGSTGAGTDGPHNGGWCPDGTWSPVADGSDFWGDIMGDVIGVGGHGGGIALPQDDLTHGGGYQFEFGQWVKH